MTNKELRAVLISHWTLDIIYLLVHLALAGFGQFTIYKDISKKREEIEQKKRKNI